MKKTIVFTLVIALVLGLMAGCGGTAPAASTTAAPSQNSTAPAGSTAAGNTAPSGSAPVSKTLNIAISENLVTLDPHNAANLPSYQPRNMCFDPLIDSNLDNEFVPCLAEKWDISEDGKTITFYLRKGVKFSNGEDFTSADVVCTFQRLLDDKKLAISNIYWSLLTGVEAVDDHTVKITLSEPYAGLLISLAVTVIIPDEAYKQQGEALFTEQKLFGTGPWVFDEWLDGQYFHVTKNPNYWNKANYDSYYDDVYVRIILEPTTAIAAQLSDTVQAYITSGGISSDMAKMYDGTQDRIELLSMDSGAVQYMGLSCKEGSPFADKNARKAVMYGIDRQSIVDYIFGGDGVVPDSFMVKGTLGYSDKVVRYTYDEAKAKEYFSKSNYNGQQITLTSNTATAKAQETLLYVSEQLNKLGFKTKVEIVEVAAMSDMRASGNYDAFLVVSMQEHDDPIKYINQRIRTDMHHSYFKNEELNSKIVASNVEMNADKRKALLEDIVATWSDELVHIPVIQLKTTYAVTKGVTGIGLFRDGMYNFKFVDHE